jgi:exonuclease SbcC
MLKRIELVNFMSHRHTVLDLAPGLTVLVGPNNCGKSAVVAALQILCHNDNSTYVLRHGEKECSIRVDTDDGHVVEWHRKKTGGPYYVINGKTYDRLSAGGMPQEELRRYLRLPLVDAGDKQFDIHFGEQKSPIFLLHPKEASGAASFFASSSDAVRLVQMQTLHRQKAMRAQGRKRDLESEAEKIAAELEALGPAVDLERRVQEIDSRYELLMQLGAEIEQTALAEAGIRRQTSVATRHAALADALGPLAAPPDLEATQPLFEHCANQTAAIGRCELATAVDEALAALPALPRLSDVEPLEKLLDDLHSETQAEQHHAQEHAAIEELLAPPALVDVAPLTELIGATHEAVDRVARWSGIAKSVPTIAPPGGPEDTAPLEELIQRLDRAAGAVAEARADAVDVDEALTDAVAELRDWTARSPYCPTCGGRLDPDRLLAHAEASHGG